MSWEDIILAMSRARALNQGLQGVAAIDLLRPVDALELTEISAAFVRIPGLLLISDEVGLDVSESIPIPGFQRLIESAKGRRGYEG
jgi:hypothetical protein